MTLYALAFDQDVMILAELTIQSLGRAKQLSMSLSDYQQAIMIDLDDLDKIHFLALEHLVVKKRKLNKFIIKRCDWSDSKKVT